MSMENDTWLCRRTEDVDSYFDNPFLQNGIVCQRKEWLEDSVGRRSKQGVLLADDGETKIKTKGDEVVDSPDRLKVESRELGEVSASVTPAGDEDKVKLSKSR